jgi:catechol 2,3-dioxygenase-like lactoylglutathione lyase family enzyme
MEFRVVALNHVNVTVPTHLEAAAKHFYGAVLGLRQIPKPAGPRQNIGEWYELGVVQLHLSVEDRVTNAASDRHVCYVVADIAVAERHLRDAGTEIIPDPRPIAGTKRFYVRDPGGNLIELTEA